MSSFILTTLRGVYKQSVPLVTLQSRISPSTTACMSTYCVIKKHTLTPQPSTNAVVHSQTRGLADKKEVHAKVEEYRKGNYDTLPDPGDLTHFRSKQRPSVSDSVKSVEEAKKEEEDSLLKKRPEIVETVLPHPIWSEKQLNEVTITHKEPEGFVDKWAYMVVKILRGGFDVFSGFSFGKRTEKKWLNRICFLETVAGVPGMVAAMLRHMKSLRRMQRDQGWIHTLLEEAENERMHLLTALQLKQPSLFFRLCVIGSQGVFVTMFAGTYIVSPKVCHRFVGYLEEEAVKTYTKCLEDIDEEDGALKHWRTQLAPQIAITYWKLEPDATMRDVILAIRADEAHHRVVNHSLASLKEDEFNPWKPGK